MFQIKNFYQIPMKEHIYTYIHMIYIHHTHIFVFDALSVKYPAMHCEKQRHLLKKIQETLYIGQCYSSQFIVGTLGPYTVLPVSLPLFKTLCTIFCQNGHQLSCHIFLNLIDDLKSLLFQRRSSFRTSQKSQGTKSPVEVA